MTQSSFIIRWSPLLNLRDRFVIMLLCLVLLTSTWSGFRTKSSLKTRLCCKSVGDARCWVLLHLDESTNQCQVGHGSIDGTKYICSSCFFFGTTSDIVYFYCLIVCNDFLPFLIVNDISYFRFPMSTYLDTLNDTDTFTYGAETFTIFAAIVSVLDVSYLIWDWLLATKVVTHWHSILSETGSVDKIKKIRSD